MKNLKYLLIGILITICKSSNRYDKDLKQKIRNINVFKLKWTKVHENKEKAVLYGKSNFISFDILYVECIEKDIDDNNFTKKDLKIKVF